MSNLRHDNKLWNKPAGHARLAAELRDGRSVVAATAVDADGIEYRLLFTADGAVLDGAEGGLLERAVAARLAEVPGAAAALWDAEPLGRLTGDDAAVYGDIRRLFWERFDPDPAGLELAEALRAALATGGGGLVVTEVAGQGPAVRCLLLPDGRRMGRDLPPEVLAEAARLAPDLTGLAVIEAAGRRFVLDPYRPLPPLFFLGAGLVSRLAAPLGQSVAFRVVVMDADPFFASRQRFPLADEVVVVPHFVDCFAGRHLSGDASVVVATRGHAYDSTALAQALETQAGYVGMMGCKADGRARVDGLRATGVPEDTLARVHTPIGLPLGGRTPEEIAMSIVAEVVASRNARAKGR